MNCSFFANLERICSSGYVATVNDVLRMRVPTTGVTETCFRAKGAEFRRVVLLCALLQQSL